MTVDWKREWGEFAVIAGVGLPFLFFGLGSIDLLDPDEGLYGSIALEMSRSGDWITPHFNGLRYLEKPPLYFWLTAATILLFGQSEWVIRLWSALPAFGAALLTWRIGALLFGRYAGVLSAIVLVTNVGLFRYARVAATDCLLVFSLSLSLYGFIRLVLDRRAETGPVAAGPICFYLGMALGLLSKGLIGAVFPLLITGLYLWFSNERLTAQRIWLKRGLILFFGLVLPWHLLAARMNPGFFDFYIVDNQLLRFLNTRGYIEDDVPIGTIAFLALMLIWFFPWSLSVVGALRHGFRDTRSGSMPEERLRLLVGLWAVVVLGFFSFSGSKLEHYMLPALPPLSLMVGALWSDAIGASERLSTLKWPLAFSALCCAIVGVGLLVVGDWLTPDALLTWLAELNVYYRILKEQGAPFPFPSLASFARLAKEWGLLLLIGVPVAFLLFSWRGALSGFAGMTAVAAVGAVLVFRLLLVIEPHHSAKPVALALKATARPGEPIIHHGSLEYSGSLPFYTGRQIRVLNGRRGDLEFGSRYPEGQGIFLDDGALARMWRGPQRVYLVTRESGQENALAGLSGQPVFHLGRYGSRELYSNKSTASDN